MILETGVWITILVHFGLNAHPSHSEIPVTVNVTQADHCSPTQVEECTQTEETIPLSHCSMPNVSSVFT